MYLRRNSEGKSDAQGKIYAVPYRWGSMVIAYRKNKFRQHKLAPIEVISAELLDLSILTHLYEEKKSIQLWVKWGLKVITFF